jgi:hypothetical protein
VKLIVLALSLSFVALVACASEADPAADPAAESTAADTGGCHQVCPHCSSKPGTECPLSPCYLQCNDGQGHTTCPDNELCIQGYRWNSNACKCVH